MTCVKITIYKVYNDTNAFKVFLSFSMVIYLLLFFFLMKSEHDCSLMRTNMTDLLAVYP